MPDLTKLKMSLTKLVCYGTKHISYLRLIKTSKKKLKTKLRI